MSSFENGIKALIKNKLVNELFFRNDPSSKNRISLSYSKNSQFKIRSKDLVEKKLIGSSNELKHPALVNLFNEISQSVKCLLLNKGYTQLKVCVTDKQEHFIVSYTCAESDIILVRFKALKDFTKGAVTIRDICVLPELSNPIVISKLGRCSYVHSVLPIKVEETFNECM